jgi:hypothetical protein
MLQWLRESGKATDRGFRLFACACVRRAWHLLLDDRSRRAVEVSERYADGHADGEALRTAAEAAGAALYSQRGGGRATQNAAEAAFVAVYAPHVRTIYTVLPEAVRAAGYVGYAEEAFDYPETFASFAAIYVAQATVAHAAGDAEAYSKSLLDVEYAAQAELVRDLFGDRFGRHAGPLLLNGNPGLRLLAQAAYDDRRLPEGTLDAGRLAVLADALEESGCTDAWLLGHLRSPGPHVRGCHALDLVLGKS